mgnify:CR=1 FL=1
MAPVERINVWPASVNTGISSTVPLNSNVRAAEPLTSTFPDPSCTYKGTSCTGLACVPAVDPFNDITRVPTLELAGSVAPVADIAILPVVSDEIVAPPMFTVSADRYAVCHLRDSLPN